MRKVKLTITIEVDEQMFGLEDKEGVDWFFNEVLSDQGILSLHSNDIGDTIGDVINVEKVHFID